MTGLLTAFLDRVPLLVEATSSLAIWVPATAILAGTLVGALVSLVGKKGETRVSADAQLIAGQLNYIGQVTRDNHELRTEMASLRTQHASEMAALRAQYHQETEDLRAQLRQMKDEAEALRARMGRVEKEVDGFG